MMVQKVRRKVQVNSIQVEIISIDLTDLVVWVCTEVYSINGF